MLNLCIYCILGQSFPPSSDLHRLSSGAEDDYRSGSAADDGGEEDGDVWNYRTSVKFQDVGDEEEELEKEVSVLFIIYMHRLSECRKMFKFKSLPIFPK